MTDPKALDPLPTMKDRRVMLANYAIESKPLMPWMKQFALWLASQPVRPKVSEQTKIASRLSRAKINKSILWKLNQRDDFKSLVERLETDDNAKLVAKFEGRKSRYLDAHYKALKGATADKDYELMAQISEPVLDRISPKKSDHGSRAANVVIVHLGPKGSFAEKHARIDDDIVDAVIESEEVGGE